MIDEFHGGAIGLSARNIFFFMMFFMPEREARIKLTTVTTTGYVTFIE